MGNTGILMNARMGQFILDDTVNPYNVVGPGKRPRTTLTPTIVLRDGKAYMSLSTPGTERQDQSILQVVLNIVEFGMNPQEAVEAARVETLHVNQSGRTSLNKKGVLQVEGRVAAEVVEELKKRGHIIDPLKDYGMNSGVTVAMFDTKDRTLAGGADVRRDRYGMAW
jgi:gamma-glutamyltranspeptidase/glutathione hydrolase